jgi:hypothetical protein
VTGTLRIPRLSFPDSGGLGAPSYPYDTGEGLGKNLRRFRPESQARSFEIILDRFKRVKRKKRRVLKGSLAILPSGVR